MKSNPLSRWSRQSVAAVAGLLACCGVWLLALAVRVQLPANRGVALRVLASSADIEMGRARDEAGQIAALRDVLPQAFTEARQGNTLIAACLVPLAISAALFITGGIALLLPGAPAQPTRPRDTAAGVTSQVSPSLPP